MPQPNSHTVHHSTMASTTRPLKPQELPRCCEETVVSTLRTAARFCGSWQLSLTNLTAVGAS